jgi:hypothetical protein
LIEDVATGASIVVRLFGPEEWRRALAPFSAAKMTGEEGEELFFVATKG